MQQWAVRIGVGARRVEVGRTYANVAAIAGLDPVEALLGSRPPVRVRVHAVVYQLAQFLRETGRQQRQMHVQRPR